MFRIVKKERLNPTVTKMVIDAPFIAKKAEPGQFIILRALEDSERIPLTIADYDRQGGTVTIIYQIVGGSTMELDTLEEGQTLHDFVGPLGVATHTEGLKKVAVVGSGPAGLACAGKLARMGYSVTVFEALHTPGGVLAYGIPAFRLPKDILHEEITGLEKLGVTIQTDTVIGRTIPVEELLKDGFSAVFLGSGAGLPNFMGIPGETLCGVFSANEWLTRINLMHAAEPGAATPLMPAKHVVVVGGGNVAMDAARCALRCGAEVTIVYRRGREELPARAEEVEHAEEEGITFRLLTNPVEILGDENGFVTGIRCDTMALGEPDESGRRRPEVVPGAQFTLDCDAVIMAIGTTPNPLLHRTTAGLAADRRGRLTTEEGSCRTSLPGVFAGGDAVTGAATVILAMGAGRKAAQEIDEYLRKNPSH